MIVVIIPGKAVAELERLLGELVRSSEDDVVALGFDDEFLQLSLGFGDESGYKGMQVGMVARLIEGKFLIIAVYCHQATIKLQSLIKMKR